VTIAAVRSLYVLLLLLLAVRFVLRGGFKQTMSARILVLRTLLTVVASVPLVLGAPVDGLEYEDAYIHKSAARYQLFHGEEPSAGFFVRTCVVGSISKCSMSASFGTHTIGFSALISGISQLTGHGSRLANLLSGLCWIFTVHCLWSVFGVLSHRSVARVIGLGLLLSSPAVYVIGGTSFAEPLFGSLLMLCVWQMFSRPGKGEGKWRFGVSLALWLVSLLLLVLAKKEGLLFIGVMSIWDTVQYWRAAGTDRIRSRLWAAVSMAAFAVAVGVFGLLEAVSRHSVDIGMPAFDVHYIAVLALPVLHAAVTPEYFGVAWVAFAASLLFIRGRSDGLRVLLSMMVMGYLLLYAVHARHYWFALGQEVQPYEMVRYLYSLTPPACLIAGSVLSNGVNRLLGSWGHDQPAVIAWAAFLLVVVGVGGAQVGAMAMREDMAHEEARSWRNSLKSVAANQNGGMVFVSSRTTALQAYASESTEFVDFVALGDPRLQAAFTQLRSERRIVLLDDGGCGSPLVRRRWVQACAMLQRLAE